MRSELIDGEHGGMTTVWSTYAALITKTKVLEKACVTRKAKSSILFLLGYGSEFVYLSNTNSACFPH